MLLRLSPLAALLAGLLLSPSLAIPAESSVADQNWPNWRGPLTTGVSPTADSPTQWSEDKNVKWKVKIPGRGLASPVVWGDRVFIQTAIPTGKKIERPAKEEK